MIVQFQLERFKAFKTHEPIRLAPLTIVAGLNSSGKSSLLQSLLLLKQTIEADQNPEALALDGAYLQYSQLREMAFGLPQLGAASIKYSFKVESRQGESGEVEFELRHKQLPGPNKRQGTVVNTFKCCAGEDQLALRLRDKVYRWPVNRSFSVAPPESLKPVEVPSVEFDGFLPSFVRQQFEAKVKGEHARLDYRVPMDIAARELSKIISTLRSDLEKLQYLGPVRAAPKRAYVHYTSNYELAPDGSNAAQVLWLRKDEKIKWGDQKKPLLEAVNECLQMMGLLQGVAAKQFRRIVYQLQVQTLSDKKKSVTIADVGFGFSQLLPVILRGLLPPDRTLVLFEQPEIHLHPACAGRLADLFLHFIKSGKQVLVETHSVELINRLRLRVIEMPAVSSQVNIVFVSPPDQVGAGSQVQQLQLGSDGMSEIWPVGFCDESAIIARAIIAARQKARIEK